MVTAGDIVREARKISKESGRSEIEVIRTITEPTVKQEQAKAKRSSGGSSGTKTAGDIVREARVEASTTGQNELELIRQKSAEQSAKDLQAKLQQQADKEKREALTKQQIEQQARLYSQAYDTTLQSTRSAIEERERIIGEKNKPNQVPQANKNYSYIGLPTKDKPIPLNGYKQFFPEDNKKDSSIFLPKEGRSTISNIVILQAGGLYSLGKGALQGLGDVALGLGIATGASLTNQFVLPTITTSVVTNPELIKESVTGTLILGTGAKNIATEGYYVSPETKTKIEESPFPVLETVGRASSNIYAPELAGEIAMDIAGSKFVKETVPFGIESLKIKYRSTKRGLNPFKDYLTTEDLGNTPYVRLTSKDKPQTTFFGESISEAERIRILQKEKEIKSGVIEYGYGIEGTKKNINLFKQGESDITKISTEPGLPIRKAEDSIYFYDLIEGKPVKVDKENLLSAIDAIGEKYSTPVTIPEGGFKKQIVTITRTEKDNSLTSFGFKDPLAELKDKVVINIVENKPVEESITSNVIKEIPTNNIQSESSLILDKQVSKVNKDLNIKVDTSRVSTRLKNNYDLQLEDNIVYYGEETINNKMQNRARFIIPSIQSSVNNNAQILSLNNKQKSDIITIPKLETVTRNRLEIINKNNLKLNQSSESIIIPKQDIITKLKQDQSSDLIQEPTQEFKSSEPPIENKIIDTPEIVPPQKLIPPRPFNFGLPTRDKQIQKQKYSVEVRRKGKFTPVAVTENLQSAFNIGSFNVKQTASASFRVRKLGTISNIQQQQSQSVFSESKREKGVYVQGRSFRISSAGEKRDITYKGIFASRFKRRK